MAWVRQQFPVFQTTPNMVFMDNAGGSQTVRHALDAISDFLIHSDVQLGASYATSVRAADKVQSATAAIQTYLNAAHADEVVLGPSSTALVRILSQCLSQTWQPGDEVVITDVDHETNRSAWLALQQQGIVIKTWQIRPDDMTLHSEDLLPLLTERTRLVCFTHVSNILGSIHPVAEWTQLVHEHGAQVCVDGVAHAPHRLLDVAAWDVDYYYFSTYKTFGPHQAVLYGKRHLLQALPGHNHDFIQSLPYKFQPGNVNYELCCAMGGVVQYLCDLGAGPAAAEINRANLIQAHQWIAEHEAQLLQRLLDYLNTVPAIRIIGLPTADPKRRVATLSLVHDTLSSAAIVQQVDRHHIGIRFGDFYAVELINNLGLRPKQGVVRISLAHYNTMQDVNQLMAALKTVF
ncbi:cysteine desulfurase-like protein [Marinicella meishanensis]|uniref:cysteine desulfurase-like protein n=1 Tax=Marinicella meishanensis TaxID=2873263 RepID=UPI001CC0C916|nr:cysteine desulfurase-like protein [Marinicella sp. NBU2979]